MSVLVFGSLNIDKTYNVDHLVRPGETISASGLQLFAGGKGLNQAIAARRAGAEVFFAGAVGNDGDMLRAILRENDIDDSFVIRRDCASGHAVIQVDGEGRNSIIILAGANGTITEEQIDKTLRAFCSDDMIILQNEINYVDKIIKAAHQKGMRVCYNPSPMNEKVSLCDLSKVDMLFVNENEGQAIAGENCSQERVLTVLGERYPDMEIVLTLGERGSMRYKGGKIISCKAEKAEAVDTTAAGDTYTGYYIAGSVNGMSASEAMRFASYAAAISVSKKGAVASIPRKEEVTAYMEKDS